jgi:MFS family permease
MNSSPHQTRKAWGIAAMLCGLQLVNFVDKVVVGLVAVPMMADLGLTPVQFGLVAGSVFWLFAIGGVLGGFVANRFQTRWLLLGMAIVWSLVQIPIAVSSSIAVLVAARVLLGFAEGPSAPVGQHGLFKWFPNDKRNLPLAVYNMGSALGVVVAGAMIPLVTQHWGWRANFWVLTAIGLAWAVLWLIFGAEGTLDAKAEVSRGATGVAIGRVPYLRLLTDRTSVGVFLLYFCAFWLVALALTWLPAYLGKGLGFEGRRAGELFALIVVASVPIGLLVPWWSQRMLVRGATSRSGRALVACAALAVAGATLVAMHWLGLSAMTKLLVMALAIGLATAVLTLSSAMISEIAPAAQRSAMLGIEIAVFGSLAGVLAPVAMGWFVQNTTGTLAQGYETGFAVTGLVAIAGALLGAVLLDPDRSQRRLQERLSIAAKPRLA